MRVFDCFVLLSQFVGLFQPLLHLPPVDIVFGSYRPLVAFTDWVLVVALNGAQLKVQTVAVSLFKRYRTLDISRVFVKGSEFVLCPLVCCWVTVVVGLEFVEGIWGVLGFDVADVVVVVVTTGECWTATRRQLGALWGIVVEVWLEEFRFGGLFLKPNKK